MDEKHIKEAEDENRVINECENRDINECENNLPIGVFDSGVGGISVLKEAMKYLPNEKFIYFGDNLNAPYGDKTEEEIYNLTEKAVDYLSSKNIKALLIACNTATSAAVSKLRNKLDIPVIGMEPAIKTAINSDSVEKFTLWLPMQRFALRSSVI